jgi:hypothetical protein
MEYMTQEQFDEVGMNIMHVLDYHLKLIKDLTRQNEEWSELISGLLNTVKDLQVRVKELEMNEARL